MPEAHISLANGTEVTVKGSPEEIHRLLELYGGTTPGASREVRSRKVSARPTPSRLKDEAEAAPDLMKIVNMIKTCDESDLIEREILDKSGQVERVLLPLFICNKYLSEEPALTSGDISRITKELGVPIRIPNVSTTLSKAASKYVIADQVRRKGTPIKYKLSRKGIAYVESLLQPTV